MLIFIKNLSKKTKLYYHEIRDELVIVKQIRDVSLPLYHMLYQKKFSYIHNIIEINQKQSTVMLEHIKGENLQEIFDREGRLDFNFFYEPFYELLNTLESLHNINIIHKDIKPANIIYSENKFFLIDFDGSRIFDDEKNQDTVLLGTNGFASPEHYGYQQTDLRSDIYSLGEVINQIFKQSTPLIKISEKCKKIDPKDCYQSIAELKKELSENFVSNTLISNKNIIPKKTNIKEDHNNNLISKTIFNLYHLSLVKKLLYGIYAILTITYLFSKFSDQIWNDYSNFIFLANLIGDTIIMIYLLIITTITISFFVKFFKGMMTSKILRNTILKILLYTLILVLILIPLTFFYVDVV